MKISQLIIFLTVLVGKKFEKSGHVQMTQPIYASSIIFSQLFVSNNILAEVGFIKGTQNILRRTTQQVNNLDCDHYRFTWGAIQDIVHDIIVEQNFTESSFPIKSIFTREVLQSFDSIVDANNFIDSADSGRQNDFQWQPTQALSSDLINLELVRWKKAAAEAIKQENWEQARVLIGQSLHIVQAYHCNLNKSSAENDALRASNGLLHDIKNATGFSLWNTYKSVLRLHKGSELVLVIDLISLHNVQIITPTNFIFSIIRNKLKGMKDFDTSPEGPRRIMVVTFHKKGLISPATFERFADLETYLDSLAQRLSQIEQDPKFFKYEDLFHVQRNITDVEKAFLALTAAARNADTFSTILLFTSADSDVQMFPYATPVLLGKKQRLFVATRYNDLSSFRSLAAMTGGRLVTYNREEEAENFLDLFHVAINRYQSVLAEVFVENAYWDPNAYSFHVDDFTEEVTIIVSSFSNSLPSVIHITDPSGNTKPLTEKQISSGYAVIPISNPLPGTWRLSMDNAHLLVFAKTTKLLLTRFYKAENVNGKITLQRLEGFLGANEEVTVVTYVDMFGDEAYDNRTLTAYLIDTYGEELAHIKYENILPHAMINGFAFNITIPSVPFNLKIVVEAIQDNGTIPKRYEYFAERRISPEKLRLSAKLEPFPMEAVPRGITAKITLKAQLVSGTDMSIFDTFDSPSVHDCGHLISYTPTDIITNLRPDYRKSWRYNFVVSADAAPNQVVRLAVAIYPNTTPTKIRPIAYLYKHITVLEDVFCPPKCRIEYENYYDTCSAIPYTASNCSDFRYQVQVNLTDSYAAFKAKIGNEPTIYSQGWYGGSGGNRSSVTVTKDGESFDVVTMEHNSTCCEYKHVFGGKAYGINGEDCVLQHPSTLPETTTVVSLTESSTSGSAKCASLFGGFVITLATVLFGF